ncbi:MAG: hypothetical protein R6X03_08795 [Methyloceanibacter sp.]|jgi:hypothetical protein
MKFLIGALALAVIGVIFVLPVVVLLGGYPLTASGRQNLGKTMDRGKLSHIERQFAPRAATSVN